MTQAMGLRCDNDAGDDEHQDKSERARGLPNLEIDGISAPPPSAL
jgi:hypothetical protein